MNGRFKFRIHHFWHFQRRWWKSITWPGKEGMFLLRTSSKCSIIEGKIEKMDRQKGDSGESVISPVTTRGRRLSRLSLRFLRRSFFRSDSSNHSISEIRATIHVSCLEGGVTGNFLLVGVCIFFWVLSILFRCAPTWPHIVSFTFYVITCNFPYNFVVWSEIVGDGLCFIFQRLSGFDGIFCGLYPFSFPQVFPFKLLLWYFSGFISFFRIIYFFHFRDSWLAFSALLSPICEIFLTQRIEIMNFFSNPFQRMKIDVVVLIMEPTLKVSSMFENFKKTGFYWG